MLGAFPAVLLAAVIVCDLGQVSAITFILPPSSPTVQVAYASTTTTTPPTSAAAAATTSALVSNGGAITTTSQSPTIAVPVVAVSQFVNRGGPLLQLGVIQPIFWGQAGTLIDAIRGPLNILYSNIVKTNYLNLQEYGIFVPSYNGSVFQVDNSRPSYDDASDIQPFLMNLISSGTISPGPQTYFPVYIYSGYATYGNLMSCNDFCYYRNSMDISSLGIANTPTLYYAVFPLLTGGCPACTKISTIGDLFVNSAKALTSALTNPAGASGTGIVDSGGSGYGVGEYCTAVVGDQRLFEVATNDASRFFVLPGLWSNRLGGCTVDFAQTVRSS